MVSRSWVARKVAASVEHVVDRPRRDAGTAIGISGQRKLPLLAGIPSAVRESGPLLATKSVAKHKSVRLHDSGAIAREVEPNLRRALFYPDPEGREVRLLEIVDGSPSAEDVLPFRFAADEARGVHYPVVIVELSPEEFERVEHGQLTLPAGWTDPQELYAA